MQEYIIDVYTTTKYVAQSMIPGNLCYNVLLVTLWWLILGGKFGTWEYKYRCTFQGIYIYIYI